jgi:hypothetical protein
MTHNFDTLPDDDVLSQSRFHFLLVAFHAPAGWPLWWVVLVGAGWPWPWLRRGGCWHET